MCLQGARTYRELINKLKTSCTRVVNSMGGKEEFTRKIQSRLSLVLTDYEVVGLAQAYGWTDDWMGVTARKAKAKAPASHSITDAMAKAAMVGPPPGPPPVPAQQSGEVAGSAATVATLQPPPKPKGPPPVFVAEAPAPKTPMPKACMPKTSALPPVPLLNPAAPTPQWSMAGLLATAASKSSSVVAPPPPASPEPEPEHDAGNDDDHRSDTTLVLGCSEDGQGSRDTPVGPNRDGDETGRAVEYPWCVICQEPMKVPSQNAVIPCGHVFHAQCVQHWKEVANISAANACPLRCHQRAGRGWSDVFASMAPSSTTMHNGSGSASSTMAEAPSTNRGQDGDDDVVVQEDSDGWAMEDEDESNAEEASEQFL